jgi:hypothetical protein
LSERMIGSGDSSSKTGLAPFNEIVKPVGTHFPSLQDIRHRAIRSDRVTVVKKALQDASIIDKLKMFD